ncbi:formin-like protein 14 [Dioscorea cayenensis subsp. rotundata]|uniref:Formin-like protein 14 n=1 Tax=Dioscorea cayennensis subsp. rotundata TaxID=55577 RepID=A0AB40C8K7_DIOCR|nr:formin-like protein 14 [Dioscorea cayenensis subsp. rotundata]
MESKKENPMGMCEKLFNVFNVNNSAFRPLRRLTFKNQEQPTTTTTPNQSPPNKPPQVLENNNHNPSSHDNHHQQHQHHDTPSLPPKTVIEPQQINNTLPPPKKPLDGVQVQVPSKIEIQKQQAQQKVPVNPPETGKAHRRTTTTKKEEAPPPPPPPSVPTSVAPKVVVPQAQLPVPTPPVPAPAPVPATVAGGRQPQRLETKNIDGKADDFINRVRNKLRNGSNVGKATSN